MHPLEKLLRTFGVEPQELIGQAQETRDAMVQIANGINLLNAKADAAAQNDAAIVIALGKIWGAQQQLNSNLQVLLDAIKDLKAAVRDGQHDTMHHSPRVDILSPEERRQSGDGYMQTAAITEKENVEKPPLPVNGNDADEPDHHRNGEFSSHASTAGARIDGSVSG